MCSIQRILLNRSIKQPAALHCQSSLLNVSTHNHISKILHFEVFEGNVMGDLNNPQIPKTVPSNIPTNTVKPRI